MVMAECLSIYHFVILLVLYFHHFSVGGTCFVRQHCHFFVCGALS